MRLEQENTQSARIISAKQKQPGGSALLYEFPLRPAVHVNASFMKVSVLAGRFGVVQSWPKRPVGYGSTLGNLPTGPGAPTSNNNNDDNNNKNNNKNKKGSTHSPMFTELVSLEISRICSKILAFFYKLGSFSQRIFNSDIYCIVLVSF